MPQTGDQGFETKSIRTQANRGPYREHSVPIYATSSYVFDSAEQARDSFAGREEGLVYSRCGNPRELSRTVGLEVKQERGSGV